MEDEIVSLIATRLYSAGWRNNSTCLTGQPEFVVCKSNTTAIALFSVKLSLIKLSKKQNNGDISCMTSDSIGCRKYLLPSRLNAYIYTYPILLTANSVADILVYNYARALLR